LTGFRGQPTGGTGKAPRGSTAGSGASASPYTGRETPKRVVVPFEDNRHLSNLLGEFDSNLALIEDRLGITANVHGNVVSLVGSETACRTAREVLEKLYDRVAAGELIGQGDFDGLLRHASLDETSPDGQAQIATRKRVIKARTPTQTSYMQALHTTDLVFGVGPAGTGKTYLAVAQAAHCLERGIVERIILSRPAVEAGERLGFLPGDMKEKVDPYLRPLYDALYDVLAPEKVERDIEAGVIEIAPLAFMRGRTLSNAFVILDEAQNTTSMQMKMFLTRLGEGSKMVVTGDPSQIDLPSGMASGLGEAVGLLKGVEGVAAIEFSGSDVVRRELVARIVAAYDSAEKSGSLGASTRSRGTPSGSQGSGT